VTFLVLSESQVNLGGLIAPFNPSKNHSKKLPACCNPLTTNIVKEA
jgi:hypothetical protein